MRIVELLAIILVLTAVLNLFRWFSTYRYFCKFRAKDPKLSEYIPAVERLFDKAGTNQVFAATRFAGKSITFCLGMNNYRTELDEIFKQTIGVYKFRVRNTFNPLYWFELPSRIVKHYGISPRPLSQRILNFLFWAVGISIAWLIQKSLDALFPGLPSILESILR